MLSFVASIVLILAPFTPSPHRETPPPPPPTVYPPEVVADMVIHSILAQASSDDAEAILRQVVADEAQAAQEAAEAAQRAAQVVAPVTAPQAAPAPVAASGDCYSGTPIPAYIINRESGGSPTAVNPSSGAYGCFQLMPMHFGSGGTCAGLSTDLAGQKACANRLYEAAGLSPWAL